MEDAVISSVARDAAYVAQRGRSVWRATTTFGLGLIGTGIGALLVAILLSGADPSGLEFVLPMLAIVGGLMYVVRKHGRWAQGVAASLALAFGAMLAPMVPGAAVDSFFDFVPLVMCLLGVAIVIGSAAADLARRDPSPRLSAAFMATGIVIVSAVAVAAAVSAVATFAGQETLSAAERDGRIAVAMKDSAFAPRTISVTEGEEVRIALKNGDAVIHDLHVPELDLKFTVKPGSEKAFDFVAPAAGSYAFDCSLHTNMKGVLEVAAR